ncbi:copper resistance D family protein [Brevibacillus agri]|uniref:copper resistance D family protein n=1 Tax=Brevibacillus agri TaxID=51101 RepID=UPI001EE53A5C|nr:CopD family protein [Brevibacillus agri]MCG5254728.1 CopD family protein [Brevibacillus agri]
MFTLSEIGLYLCFSILVGGLLLQIVPANHRPTLVLSKKYLLWAVAGIGVLSFMPVLRVILFFISDPNFNPWLLTTSVLFSFEIGQAWWVTLALSVVLFIMILRTNQAGRSSQEIVVVKLVVAFGLVLALGWSSHAASYFEWRGFFAHTAHFLAMVVWLGILLVTGWFSKGMENWSTFLAWFHPLAITCVLITTSAGIILTLDISPEYLNGWILSYGQALLIKHLLLIPLLLFGFINGFLLKKRLKELPNFNPLGWFRAESVFVLAIFGVTAFMGQQETPHNVAATLKMAEPSPLFTYLYQGVLDRNPSLSLAVNGNSAILFAAALMFAAMVVLAFWKKMPPYISVVMGILFTVTGYLALMLSIR